ncbi:MAG: potassium-transporting ATPase subunit KdpA [Parachlamydiales bacterium]|jgi:K+-transporting ATPase ATPase A chain
MTNSWLELGLFIVLFLLFSPLLGRYLAGIYKASPSRNTFFLGSFEKLIYRFCNIQPDLEMSWKEYAKALLVFNLLGFLFVLTLQLAQGYLPLNPQGLGGVEFWLAFNTAASFVTNTNWQAYGGEVTLSYFTQMMALTVQNFVSAATGLAVLVAFIRGIIRRSTFTIGNFWNDMTRTIVYLFLPLCVIFSLFLVGEGVIQNISPYVPVTTLENEAQILPMGPVASQVAIKQLGTNGGGFFNANSTHPFENPTPLSNFWETFAILLIPGASVFLYGFMAKNIKECVVIFSVMFALWVLGLTVALTSESQINPVLGVQPVLEGQEVRFGPMNSVLWAVSTTATSNGSVNSMLSSLSPLAGGIALFNIILGEVIFGGVGVGLCSMFMFILLTVFLAGLMVGRTPEYMGKKIEKREIQWVMLSILAPTALILLGAGLSAVLPTALESLGNGGPHGLSEILFAFSSAAGNNGSAFAGLNANVPYYNILLGIVMLLARLAILIPSIAIAGSLAEKKYSNPTIGTFSTQTPLFGILLFSVILIIAALSAFPALSLGPIAEQFLMQQGRTF